MTITKVQWISSYHFHSLKLKFYDETAFKRIMHTLVDLKVPKNGENLAHFSVHTVTLQVQQLHQWLISTRFDEYYLEQRRLCGNTSLVSS